jgi:hypothetical protein
VRMRSRRVHDPLRAGAAGWRSFGGRAAACAALVAAAAFSGAGCGGRSAVKVPVHPAESIADLPTFDEAVGRFIGIIDTVAVHGRVRIEDDAGIPPDAIVVAESRIQFQHRRAGGGWEVDDSHDVVARDTSGVRRDGGYELRVPAVLDGQSFDPILIRDPEGERAYVLPAQSKGILLSGRAGSASASDEYVLGIQYDNYREFTLHYPREKLLVIADQTDMRASPEVGAPVILPMNFSALVDVLWREGDWARVNYRGRYGWAALKDLGDLETFEKERARREAQGG